MPNHVKKPSRLTFQPEVLDRVGLSRVRTWQLEQQGKFPRRREVDGMAAWLESEIDDWINSRPLRRLKADKVA